MDVGVIKQEPIGNSHQIRMVLAQIKQVANTLLPVLLTGETGVGKGVFAHYLHRESSRSTGPFHAVNCGSIAPTLLESELFGHEKGAFSGALARRVGLLEHADSGTVLLDEINSATPELQVRLLDFIQYGTIKRLGSNELIKPNVRLVFASNQPLEPLVTEGKFRADLFYRMQVFPINIPPLRERKSDIPLLVELLLQTHANRLRLKVPVLDAAAMQALIDFSWPGNVRQLENILQRLLVATAKASLIQVSDLPPEFFTPEYRADANTVFYPVDYHGLTLKELEARHIKQVMQRCEGNKSVAARLLGINNSTLYRKLKELEATD